MKLKLGQVCPLHRRRNCCGREADPPVRYRNNSKWETVRMGWRRIKDEHADHPDGYRYRLSKSEMQKVLDRKIVAQKGICALCHKPMDDYGNIAPDHIKPKGGGGARRDDRESNIQAVHHFPCNVEKGSKRI